VARLPNSLAIALWIVGACWLLALLALLFGLDAEVIWAALPFGVVAGFVEWLARRRNHPPGE
jgi:hypothetical protein